MYNNDNANAKHLGHSWLELVDSEKTKWGHCIYKVTGKPTRRSFVLWSCTHHPNGGKNVFIEDDSVLKDLKKKNLISSKELDELIQTYPGEQFYASRIDDYLKCYTKKQQRMVCCREKLHGTRTLVGFEIFQNLLASRGAHYKTNYTLQIDAADYKGKHVKYPIKCESHDTTFQYSMQDLNYITSCPCPLCRIDPNHKNRSVDIIKRRNTGRPGQVSRHASRVKAKYNYTCALSHSTFDLQSHHLDGQDFYTETQLLWESNGICLCGTIHRDYHFNFLLNHSIIAKEYSKNTFHLDLSPPCSESQKTNLNNPDLFLAGAEVSRYTFLEYLKFLKYDIKVKNSSYINVLNKKITLEHGSINPSDSRFGTLGKITLERLEICIQKFCAEYKGENWRLAERKDIPYANDGNLWTKVDEEWNDLQE